MSNEPNPPTGLPVGTLAPDYELRDLDGRYRPLSDWRGIRVLLVFIQEHCPHSRALLPALAGLDKPPSDQGPLPIIVSFGDAAEHRRVVQDLGIRCPLLLMDDIQVALLYQIPGSPSACLIDEEGRVAAITRIGGTAVLRALGMVPGAELGGETTSYQWLVQHLVHLLRAQTTREEHEVDVIRPTKTRTAPPDLPSLPLVSTILCTRDRPRMLQYSLELYRRQTYPNRELVVVDSGRDFPVNESTISALGGRVMRIAEGTPLGTTINIGVDAARGDIFQRWDDDDWYAPAFMETMMSAYLRDTEWLCRPKVAYVTWAPWFDLARFRVLDFSQDEAHNTPSGGTLLFGRDHWETHPYQPTRSMDDIWFLVDAVRSGALLVPVRDPEIFLYVRHDALPEELGHVWGNSWEGGDDPMEEYLKDVSVTTHDPQKVLPAWAFEGYQNLIRDLERSSV